MNETLDKLAKELQKNITFVDEKLDCLLKSAKEVEEKYLKPVPQQIGKAGMKIEFDRERSFSFSDAELRNKLQSYEEFQSNTRRPLLSATWIANTIKNKTCCIDIIESILLQKKTSIGKINYENLNESSPAQLNTRKSNRRNSTHPEFKISKYLTLIRPFSFTNIPAPAPPWYPAEDYISHHSPQCSSFQPEDSEYYDFKSNQLNDTSDYYQLHPVEMVEASNCCDASHDNTPTIQHCPAPSVPRSSVSAKSTNIDRRQERLRPLSTYIPINIAIPIYVMPKLEDVLSYGRAPAAAACKRQLHLRVVNFIDNLLPIPIGESHVHMSTLNNNVNNDDDDDGFSWTVDDNALQTKLEASVRCHSTVVPNYCDYECENDNDLDEDVEIEELPALAMLDGEQMTSNCDYSQTISPILPGLLQPHNAIKPVLLTKAAMTTRRNIDMIDFIQSTSIQKIQKQLKLCIFDPPLETTLRMNEIRLNCAYNIRYPQWCRKRILLALVFLADQFNKDALRQQQKGKNQNRNMQQGATNSSIIYQMLVEPDPNDSDIVMLRYEQMIN